MRLIVGIKKKISQVRWKELLTSPQFYCTMAFWGLIAVIFYLNAFHESYPDEWDNILGGWDILHGRLIYTGFFTHHGPAAYYLSSIVLLFSGHSFVRFRVVYNIFLFIFLGISYLLLRRQVGIEKIKFFPAIIATLAIAGTYFWSQMLLADNIAAFCLIIVYGLLFLKDFYRKSLTFTDLLVISVLNSVAILSSLTYLYILIGTYAYIAFFYLRDNRKTIVSMQTLKAAGILVFPYVVFGIYLLLTGSTKVYWYDAITFNEKYYIYNYPGPHTHINPIRFAIVIANIVFNSLATLLVQVKDFNLLYPLNITLAIGNLAVLLYLWFRGYRKLPLFVLFFMIYSNARSNPLESSEHDYQSAVYMFTTIFNIAFLLPNLYEDINSKVIETGKKVVYSVLLVVVGIYAIFTGILFVKYFAGKYYPKYMGWAPLIYDAPHLAPLINTLVPANEYVWVGPFEFEDLFYIHAKPASRVQILNPGGGESPVISGELVADIETTKPKIIWYNENFFILGQQPVHYAKIFNQELADHYVRLMDYRDGKNKYVSTVQITQWVDLDARLYMRKENVKEVIQRLLVNNMVKEVPAK
ncbi:MAG: hypothetical protein KGJ07_04800 [Patescibacteria group bacterium]|nr:hypothetical protein [Patescibacteria group bacterium]